MFLLHRGLIGGGRPGIGKGLFDSQYTGSREEVLDGTRLSKLALISAFNNSRFVNQVAEFVKEVKRIKATVDNVKYAKTISKINAILPFKDEFSGTRRTSIISNQIAAKCDHGLVVNTLAREFKNSNVQVGNSRIDLFAIDSNGNFKTLFEVKTNTNSADIYQAIGQLFFYQTALNQLCKLVTVFPKDLKEQSKKILDKLNIDLLLYEWINDKPQFINFNPKKYV